VTLRIGVLGAASIAPRALVLPARDNPEVEVAAVAARDPGRAAAFATAHGVPRVHASYGELVADPALDAVYNALPNGLHGRWTVAALRAGRHVLCEKPFAANATEAEAVAEVARRTGLVAMEAMHYRYHALTTRMLDILASGKIGETKRVDVWFFVSRDPGPDIRWDLGLAGGATMDVGCYALHLWRTLAGAEPKVRSASMTLLRPGVDRVMEAELRFPDGRPGSVGVSLHTTRPRRVGARVEGSSGTLEVEDPFTPHRGHRLVVETGGLRRAESVPLLPTTYDAQLAAFADAVLRGRPFPTDADDAVATLRAVDACYRAAGVPLRVPTP